MKEPGGRIPDWKMERLILGELPSAEAGALKAALEADPEAQARLEALTASNGEILKAYAPGEVAREIDRRLRQEAGERALSRGRGARIFAPIAALAALGLALVVALPQGDAPAPTVGQPGAAGEVTRVKGLPEDLAAKLVIHRRLGRDVERLAPGDAVQTGDTLQLSYQSGGAPFGAILSIDGRGVVTLHHPTAGHRSPVLTTSGLVTLPRSYQLDDAPDFERFVLLTAEAPFDLKAVVSSAEAFAASGRAAEGAPLPVTEGIHQTDFTVRKLP